MDQEQRNEFQAILDRKRVELGLNTTISTSLESTLTKTTTNPETQAESPSIICEGCGKDLGSAEVWAGVWLRATVCPECEEKERAVQEEEAKAVCRAQVVERIEVLLERSGVPPVFLGAKLEDFPTHLRTLKGSLFLTGIPGTGKSHLAVGLMREAILAAEPVKDYPYERWTHAPLPAFVEVPELLMEIRATYDKDNSVTEEEVIGRYSRCSFLVLDDLGVEKTTEWSLQTLYVLVNRRWREQKRTIFTSNLSLADLGAKLSDRISSRIGGMCRVIELTGKDRRLKRVK